MNREPTNFYCGLNDTGHSGGSIHSTGDYIPSILCGACRGSAGLWGKDYNMSNGIDYFID